MALSPGGWLGWLECCPGHHKGFGVHPGQGTDPGGGLDPQPGVYRMFLSRPLSEISQHILG